jgi:hypothetical protein
MYASMVPLELVPWQNAAKPVLVMGTAQDEDWDMPNRTAEL